MLSGKYLSIVIPTYNRANFLDFSLEIHIPMLREYNIQLYISDNASTDNTEQIMKKWMKEYPLLHYSRNKNNLGADLNFEKALKMPNTKYIWLLSDTYKIQDGSINYILKEILLKPNTIDMFVFNLENKLQHKSENYKNKNKLLSDLGGLMTCAAINVYNKDLIDNSDFKRYFKTNFIQMGIIFEYISDKKIQINWVQDYSLTSIKNMNLKKTNWSNTPKSFEIGCEDWTNFILSLPPSYTYENKIKCIMDFGKVSSLFSLKNLILLRADNLLNYEVYQKYNKYFAYTIDYPKWIILLLAIIPKAFFIILIQIYNNYKRR